MIKRKNVRVSALFIVAICILMYLGGEKSFGLVILWSISILLLFSQWVILLIRGDKKHEVEIGIATALFFAGIFLFAIRAQPDLTANYKAVIWAMMLWGCLVGTLSSLVISLIVAFQKNN